MAHAPLVIERFDGSPHKLPDKVEGPVVGIDLGTTNSCVAVSDSGETRVLKTAQGYETVPSVVFVNRERQVAVGHKAVEKLVLEPLRTVYGSKRFIGRAFDSSEVRTFGHFFHYELAAGKSGLAGVRVDRTVIPLEVISGYILWHLKKVAEEALGRSICRAVITVPAYFGERQRQSVRDAARLTGLFVERLLTEPTAAAVAYGHGRGLSGTVLVYDLGGGTFDASLLRIEPDRMEVLATDGDPFLGGADFDDRLTQYVLRHIARQHGRDLQEEAVSVQRIRAAAEAVKRQLSEALGATLEVPYLGSPGSQAIDVRLPISRDLFESLTTDLADRTLTIVQTVLDRAGVKSSELDDVILVGGQSRSPHIRRLLLQRFGRAPSRNVHPDLAVAMGAAIVGEAAYKSAPLFLTDILPASLRMPLPSGDTRVLLERGRRLPATAHVSLPGVGPGGLLLRLYRGEATRAADNQWLGDLVLPGGMPNARVQLTVQVDGQGIVSASARHPMAATALELELSSPAPGADAEPELGMSDLRGLPG